MGKLLATFHWSQPLEVKQLIKKKKMLLRIFMIFHGFLQLLIKVWPNILFIKNTYWSKLMESFRFLDPFQKKLLPKQTCYFMICFLTFYWDTLSDSTGLKHHSHQISGNFANCSKFGKNVYTRSLSFIF